MTCFVLEDNIQDVLEPVHFKVEDLIQGRLKPFSSSRTAFDGECLKHLFSVARVKLIYLQSI